MEYDLVIKHGRIISSGLDFVGDVAVAGERIAALGQNLSGRREIDARGKYVIPGGIDGHVHMRTERPTFRYDETFETGSVAAAFGGTTTMIDQVQAEYGRSLNAELDTRLALAESHSAIDFALHMNIREPIQARLDEIPSIFARGLSSWKWFMAGAGWQVPDDFLLRGLRAVAEQGGLSIVHAENPGVIQESLRHAKEVGQTDLPSFNRRAPSAAEGAAASLALAMAEVVEGRLLIFHASCEEVVEALHSAKARGVRAYGEACLSYLMHTEAVYRGDPVAALPFLISPPLRDSRHQGALWRGLKDGALDIVSTDHTAMRLAPEAQALELAAHFGIQPVLRPADDQTRYDAAGQRLLPLLPPGGIELRLPLMYTYGVLAGKIDLSRWVEVCCSRPAQVFDLPSKGQLLPGYDADIVVFDPAREIVYSAEKLHSNTDYSAWDGWVTRGAVEKTFSRGRLLVDGDQFLGALDHGHFVPRAAPAQP